MDVYNYCPDCGEPLSDLAKTKEALKVQNAKLQALQELSSYTNDKNTLLIPYFNTYSSNSLKREQISYINNVYNKKNMYFCILN